MPVCAYSEPLGQEPALHRVPRKRQRGSEVSGRPLAVAEPQFELSKGRGVKRIRSEPFGTRDGLNLVDAPLCSVSLGDRDGAVQGDNRRWPDSPSRSSSPQPG